MYYIQIEKENIWHCSVYSRALSKEMENYEHKVLCTYHQKTAHYTPAEAKKTISGQDVHIGFQNVPSLVNA